LDAGGAALAVNRLFFSTNNGGVNFRLASDVAANSSFSVLVTFSTPLGTWETPGNQNPFQTSNQTDAQFASAIHTNFGPLGLSLGDTAGAAASANSYEDLTFVSTVDAAPTNPPGTVGGSWDWTSDANPNADTSSGVVRTGATDQISTFSFLNGPGIGTATENYNASLRDDGTTGATNFTQTLRWDINTGENALLTDTAFRFTLDGSPFTIPEPSSFALLASALTIPILRRKRKQH